MRLLRFLGIGLAGIFLLLVGLGIVLRLVGYEGPSAAQPIELASEPEPTVIVPTVPVPPVSAEAVSEVDEAHSRLTAAGVTASELRSACTYYAENEFAYTTAWAEANKVAADAGSDPDPRRIADVVTQVSTVVEDIVLPEGFALGVVATMEAKTSKPLSDWGEAEHTQYDDAIIARKRQLIDPLCSAAAGDA